MGVYQIKNRENGKILIGSSVNVPAMLNRCRAELRMGSFRNTLLQKEWNRFGPERFEFKELERLEPADDPAWDPAEDLKVLEDLWLEKLTPFNEKGYNQPKAGA